MPKPGPLILTAALLVLLPATAASTCFCLVDEDDAIWFDCRSVTQGNKPHPSYFCANPAADGKQTPVPDGHRHQKVAAGEPPCTPCRRERDGVDPFRNHDEEQAAMSSTDRAGEPRRASEAATRETQPQ